MQPECRQHPTAQPEGLSKDYSARYSRGMLSLSNYGPYKPCNPWHLSAGLVMVTPGDSGGRGSRCFAEKLTRPRLVSQNSPPPEGALRGW